MTVVAKTASSLLVLSHKYFVDADFAGIHRKLLVGSVVADSSSPKRCVPCAASRVAVVTQFMSANRAACRCCQTSFPSWTHPRGSVGLVHWIQRLACNVVVVVKVDEQGACECRCDAV
jgi:hypothetical protein